jgi:adenosylcobinamide-GDP ribazoletransferase
LQRRALLTPLALLAAAVEFLTPLRLRGDEPLADAIIGRSSALFPLVGLLLGMALVGIDRLGQAVLPASAVDALLVATLALSTGGLHLDGVADATDGLFGGRTPARRLEIMRDSRVGSFGVLAVTLVLLLQFTALEGLLPPWRVPALLLFPVLGRTAMVAAIAAFPYARAQGLGILFQRYVLPWPLLIAAMSSLALAVLCFSGSGAALWGAGLLVAATIGSLMRRRIGGLTGDCYGAICELTQIVVLFMIVSAHRVGWLLPWLVRG